MTVVQRLEMVRRISGEIEQYVVELGVDGRLVVEPIGPPGSHHLRYLAGANALIDIPATTTALPAGSVVNVVVL